VEIKLSWRLAQDLVKTSVWSTKQSVTLCPWLLPQREAPKAALCRSDSGVPVAARACGGPSELPVSTFSAFRLRGVVVSHRTMVHTSHRLFAVGPVVHGRRALPQRQWQRGRETSANSAVLRAATQQSAAPACPDRARRSVQSAPPCRQPGRSDPHSRRRAPGPCRRPSRLQGGHGYRGQATSKACARSAIRSCASSMPTE
jgi:hypothetical protein